MTSNRSRGNRALLLFGAAAFGAAAALVVLAPPRERSVAPPPAAAAEPTQLWTCGMHPQVIQDRPGKCPICGMELTPVRDDAIGAQRAGERRVAYWWDPMMNPPYVSKQPGKSPMGMDLVPVYEDEVSAGPGVRIDPAVVQNMGIRVATVADGPLRKTIRAVGYLDEAEPLRHDVNLRVSGWIEHLHADTEGQHIELGAPLFDLYSPELRVAIEELIAARRTRAAAGADGGVRRTADRVYAAAERKLRLWGVSGAEIRRFAEADAAPETVTFTSPVHGHLVEKLIVDGAAVRAGDRVMRIVDHSRLWLDVQVFEQHLPYVRLGDRVRATVAGRPGEVIAGTISFIHPHVEGMTRTAMVRTEIANESLQLRPGMYATAEIDTQIAEHARLVPREAIIDTGTRQIAFVVAEGGHFEPRRVTMGAAGQDGLVQVLDGLAPGETVVTSGQFLLDAESRMREAIQKLLGDRQKPSAGSPPAHAH